MKNNKKLIKKILNYIATSLWILFALFGLFMFIFLWWAFGLFPASSGGRFDWKRDNSRMEYVNNFKYGVVGRATGFSEFELRSSVGMYRIWTGTSSPSFYNSYFDDPVDQKYIKKGIEYYNRKYSKKH